MRDQRLTIKIKKPVEEIFAFTLDPKNTPKWVESFVHEQTNESSTKVGTIYKSQNQKGEWSEFTITEFIQNQMFVFTSKDGKYHAKYTFTPVSENATELEYYEWVDEGEMEEPFPKEVLEKLKTILEN